MKLMVTTVLMNNRQQETNSLGFLVRPQLPATELSEARSQTRSVNFFFWRGKDMTVVGQ